MRVGWGGLGCDFELGCGSLGGHFRWRSVSRGEMSRLLYYF